MHVWKKQTLLLAAFTTASAIITSASDAAEPTQVPELDRIVVVGVTPGQGASLLENLMPYNVQGATDEDFERSQVLDVTDYLDRQAAGVTINSAQGNPLQPDVSFRGFTATPLLGGSEGVSVYVDGVRVNEVFGDTVNWDLIPEAAVSHLSLLAGANPVFGLNTLGGTIQIRTMDGFTDPGYRFEVQSGSFDRNETTISSGGHTGEWGYYGFANHFDENGWRDLSNSSATSFLGTLSWRGAGASFDLRLAHAETALTGNGPQSIEVLQAAPQSVFTAPDRTRNFFTGITANGTYELDRDLSISATLFGRQVDSHSYNGDATDFDACTDNDDILCDGGAPVLDQDGHSVSSGYDAINNIGVRKQRSFGGSLQAVWKRDWWSMKNQFVAGIDFDRGRVDYNSLLEASYLLPCRVDADYCLVTVANTGVVIPDDALAVHIGKRDQGVYFTDTLSVTGRLAFTLSGRYNHTRTTIADFGGNHPDLDGKHSFDRFNPAVGMTYQFGRALNLYADYNESTRAPTPVELTCASPNAPCKLPNDFLSDPDLKQVVARSFEAGLRGRLDVPWQGSMHWQAGVFGTRNRNDIVFQTTGGALSNEGFYANVGDTRRQGFEAALSGRMFDNRLDWHASFARLDATFQSPFLENSAHNPVADGGIIAVEKGDRIPGIPRNAFKVGLDIYVTDALSIGGDFVYNSSQYYRGDESNALPPIGGYGLFSLRASVRASKHVLVLAHVENVFDRRYENFGMLGDATDIYADATDPRFLSPGAPRGEWVGVRLDF